MRKQILSAFAALLALTFGRACSRSAKLKHVWPENVSYNEFGGKAE